MSKSRECSSSTYRSLNVDKQLFGCRNLGNVLGGLKNTFVGAVLGHFVGNLALRRPVLSIVSEIVDSKVDSHLFVALEDVVYTRPDLGRADHELAHADAGSVAIA